MFLYYFAVFFDLVLLLFGRFVVRDFDTFAVML